MISELNELKRQYQELLQQLTNPEILSDWQKMEELIKQKSRLEKIIVKEEELAEIQSRLEENRTIIAAGEPELTALAEEELKQLKQRETRLKQELENLEKNGEEQTVSGAKSDLAGAVIMEIRAGVGGEEAALFAANLYKMYSKYAQLKGWGVKVLDSSPTELGGYKEIVFEVSGPNAYNALQWEGGVHRVQRIPTTEKSGRVHTSTCSVACLPKPEKKQFKINPEDLKIEIAKATGPGGQNVNKRMTAVRIVHLPTGITAESHAQRTLPQNKENAMNVLAARLFEKQEREKAEALGQKRRTQIGRAKRAEKIRTYNFPQDRVTDHRIKKTFHNIEGVMEGKLEPIISALQQTNI